MLVVSLGLEQAVTNKKGSIKMNLRLIINIIIVGAQYAQRKFVNIIFYLATTKLQFWTPALPQMSLHWPQSVASFPSAYP